MSWLYSRALVEASLAASCSDGKPSAPSSGSPTPQAYLSPDRMTAFSRLSRFGMTFAPLTESLGADVLTWCLEAFLARTSALPERGPESTEPAAGCGHTWRELWAKFDPDSSSWRTLQPSLLEDSAESSPTWPRSGMTAAGQCWALPMLGRRTKETDFGWLLPTPSASDPQLERRAKHGEHYETETGTVRRKNADGSSSNLGLAAAVAKWPTPRACSAMGAAITEDAIAKAPTRFPNLETVVTMRTAWATPVRRDYRHPGRSRMERTGGKQGDCLPQQVGGALNPTWVEWLMAWPLAWTDLKPLATARFRFVRRQHSACLQEANCDAAAV